MAARWTAIFYSMPINAGESDHENAHESGRVSDRVSDRGQPALPCQQPDSRASRLQS